MTVLRFNSLTNQWNERKRWISRETLLATLTTGNLLGNVTQDNDTKGKNKLTNTKKQHKNLMLKKNINRLPIPCSERIWCFGNQNDQRPWRLWPWRAPTGYKTKTSANDMKGGNIRSRWEDRRPHNFHFGTLFQPQLDIENLSPAGLLTFKMFAGQAFRKYRNNILWQ